MKIETKLNGKRFKVPATIEEKDGRLWLSFGYEEYLKDEVKVMDGARWSPEEKSWHVNSNRRNLFRLKYLMGVNPYSQYDAPLLQIEPKRDCLKDHQKLMFRNGITYKEVIWAAEMGTGKTLAAIEVIDYAGISDCWWVAPVPALAAFEAETNKWGIRYYPKVMTYEGLTRIIKNWEPGQPAPRLVVFDESSRLKTWASQRTEAARHLVESMRKEWKDKGQDIYIIEMTGTPAPKNPGDWYPQCEIAQPGFIREGNINKFKQRLAIIEMKENDATGGSYPHMVSWRDDEKKCDICGKFADDAIHDSNWPDASFHQFFPGKNEVANLFPRLKGLVTVIFKKDVLKDLPEKNYRILTVEPTIEIRNAAKLLASQAKNAAQTLITLRELSDGFLYESEATGSKTCPTCNGSLISKIPQYAEETGEEDYGRDPEPIGWEDVPCFQCGATGEVPSYERTVKEIASGKDKILSEILADHEDDGRLVIYGAFTGTIDRIRRLVTQAGWQYISADGRGWHHTIEGLKQRNKQGMLEAFQDKSKDNLIAFIGQPGAAGMGLTLTAANEIVYFSNDFNAESRIQSEDRIHRIGMDVNRGATITDIIQLPSDLLIRENLIAKRRLQDMTLGEFHRVMSLYLGRLE